ncbi:hypothetical protein H5410_044717 [Solanum commersonii]|uniref:Uncharacterized protein n=1 Tax=Solanum commersonii TaxID=4109 RepID=A0A9J5X7R7_SOLCO|nr:hypothetical protein H5410_044717 [Solanum commersonii]
MAKVPQLFTHLFRPIWTGDLATINSNILSVVPHVGYEEEYAIPDLYAEYEPWHRERLGDVVSSMNHRSLRLQFAKQIKDDE